MLSLYLILTLLYISSISAIFHSDRRILVGRFGGENVPHSRLVEYRKSLRESVLENLQNLSPAEKNQLSSLAETEYSSQNVPKFDAWTFLDYARKGSRESYESIVTGSVRRLSLLVVGHLLDELNNTKTDLYLDVIFSDTFRILELTTWLWPAHVIPPGIPLKTDDYIDLGAGEMAKHIAFTKMLMYKKFQNISNGAINRRIDEELANRIFYPYTEKNFWWDGLGYKATVNNWNIWINTNILKSAALVLDEDVFSEVLERSLKSVDSFLNNYGDDGGTEEGPAYWREGAGRLSEYLETISTLFPDAQEYFRSVRLLKEVGDYSWKLRIAGNNFVNFADATPEIVYPPWYLWNYGKLFNDSVMKEYAAFMLSQNSSDLAIYSKPLTRFKDLNDFVSFIEIKEEIEKIVPSAPEPEVVILPDLQIVVGRSKPEFKNQNSSLFLAAKMGTNYESHSQNDVASFVLFQNELPVLIDIGVGVYNSKTFSAQRYTLFYTQSRYHNCPTINGIDQKAGSPYQSTNVTITNTTNFLQISGNIEQAYPLEASIDFYRRTIEFDREQNRVILNDQYKLKKYLAQTTLNFVTVENMKLIREEYGLNLKNDKGVDLEIHFKWSKFDLAKEFKSFENDSRLTNAWNNATGIQRFTLTTKPDVEYLEDKLTVVFQANQLLRAD